MTHMLTQNVCTQLIVLLFLSYEPDMTCVYCNYYSVNLTPYAKIDFNAMQTNNINGESF